MKNKMWLWVLIVILVVAGLVYVAGKGKAPTEEIMQVEGVKMTVLQEGSGEAAKAGDKVSMNYTGRLVDGTVFDSNVDPKFNHVEPFTFNLGAGEVIKGWDTAIVGMKAGEKRTLEIEPAAAYGDQPVGPIPPNSTLIFDVELVSINN
ncbi:MAG: FKBP-type peptidyl-prolyl cis-trans isomerase [Candidatus Pacebacteria bacterium]|nr:FKBP-type peptidyl-prolyl cis-trans isomerase [Candidatus Paceibacterota bacterium]MBP9851170.1 FKBP-type peptidyl-prolyl cis-trans isomerase [Candidatus Paceibacterota bacterium]